MSARKTFWVSLILNLLLAGWIVFRLVASAGRPDPGAAAPPPVATPGEKPSEAAAGSSLIEPRTPATTAPPPFHGRNVESADYRAYVANLRAIGCPERTVRDIISAELDELYTRRRQELVMPVVSQPWDMLAQGLQSPLTFVKDMEPRVEALEKQTRELLKEKDKDLEELLGKAAPETEQPSGRPRSSAPLTGYLSEEKQAQVEALDRKFADLAGELRRKRASGKASETDAQLAELDKQKQAELRRLLSAEEYEEHRLRTSRAASLRYRVQGLDASPDEWRELVRLQMVFDEANPVTRETGAAGKTGAAARTQALAQLDDQFKAVLGPDRFDAFKRGQQGDYQNALRVAQRCELPASVAIQVYEVKRAAESRARELTTNPNLTPEQRTAAVEAIRRETETSIRGALGDRGYQTYVDYRGDWLKQLGRR
jgi:hypothetical protein